MRSSAVLRKAFSLFLLGISSHAAPNLDFPVYVTASPNPNDYTLFANSGWDGNWYVGFNNCWIKKLPPIPPGDYARAYLGVRLGRMKTTGPVGRPPEFPSIPGSFQMAISSVAAWSAALGVNVAEGEEIPLDGSNEYAIEGTGESQWFWGEVPVEHINRKGDNYLVVWSPTPSYVQVSSAPVIAAAPGGKSADAWICKNSAGAPPAQLEKDPGTAIGYFQPALGLKLIPQGRPHPVEVHLVSWRPGTKENPKPVVTANVVGESVEKAWIEYKGTGPNWVRTGRPLWKAPYIFTFDPRPLPRGRVQLRVAAQNVWGEMGTSDGFGIEVGDVHKTGVK